MKKIKLLSPRFRKTVPQVKQQIVDKEDTSVDTTQSANWISILEEDPIWYKNLDIRTPDGVIHHEWARVSDGDNDYYVSSNPYINDIIPTITHWKYINQN